MKKLAFFVGSKLLLCSHSSNDVPSRTSAEHIHSRGTGHRVSVQGVASTSYLVFKVVAKLTCLVAIIGCHVTAKLPHIVRFMTKQNSIWSKALIMPLTIWYCVLSYKKKNYFR